MISYEKNNHNLFSFNFPYQSLLEIYAALERVQKTVARCSSVHPKKEKRYIYHCFQHEKHKHVGPHIETYILKVLKKTKSSIDISVYKCGIFLLFLYISFILFTIPQQQL